VQYHTKLYSQEASLEQQIDSDAVTETTWSRHTTNAKLSTERNEVRAHCAQSNQHKRKKLWM